MEATLRLRYAALPSTSLRTARAGSTTVADRGHFRVRIPQKQPLLRQRTPAARQQLLQLLHQEHRARPPGHPQHTLPWRPFSSSAPAPDAHRRKAALQAPQRFPPHLLPRQPGPVPAQQTPARRTIPLSAHPLPLYPSSRPSKIGSAPLGGRTGCSPRLFAP